MNSASKWPISAIGLIEGRGEPADPFREHAYGPGAQRSIFGKIPQLAQVLTLALQEDNRVNGSRNVPPAFAAPLARTHMAGLS